MASYTAVVRAVLLLNWVVLMGVERQGLPRVACSLLKGGAKRSIRSVFKIRPTKHMGPGGSEMLLGRGYPCSTRKLGPWWPSSPPVVILLSWYQPMQREVALVCWRLVV